MLKTKKDIDRHVRLALGKLRSENEKNFRGLTIAKLYLNINEYSTAQHYVTGFLSVKEDSAAAYRLLGQCHLHLKKPEKALESFQRSLQLDPKQTDLLIEICKVLVTDNTISTIKAQYWCDLAESEKVQHESVFSLRLKLLGKDQTGTDEMEERIRTEIANRPTDPNLRVRLVYYLIEHNKILDAFKYVVNLEMNSHEVFANSAEWYNVVWLVLSKYKMANTQKNWDYWCLLISCLERQVYINFNTNTKTVPNSGITETANLLYNFDQNLYEASQIVNGLCDDKDKELPKQFLIHFRGQLCLHAAALVFKKEISQNKNQWKDSTKTALPLLLFAYQFGATDVQAPWLKHCSENCKQLINLWNKEGAFRCAQAARTLLSCVNQQSSENSISSKVNHILVDRSPWNSNDDLLVEIRQICSDTAWRNKVFRKLFTNSDQTVKIPSSYFVNNQQLSEPQYELPSNAAVETYEEIAQYLRPDSLQHMTYLCLGGDNLADIRCKYFNGLSFSTPNLSFCGTESLNQLDMETFLYATAIQAKRIIEVEKNCFENYQSKSCGRPGILPFVNLKTNLCTDGQLNWWTAAYKLYKNLTDENLAEVRTTLQYGIEAVRGINGPKIDVMIVLKLGLIFMQRSQDVLRLAEKNAIEVRADQLFKYGINIYKMQNKGVLEPFRRFFKYANGNQSQLEHEINTLVEEAITFLAARYFKNSEFEECIDEFDGIELPFATFFLSEAYKKLDESNKTPKKSKKIYLDKAKDYLHKTLNLLGSSDFADTNHPLNSVIHSEIKRLQFNSNKYPNDTNTTNGLPYFPDHGEGDYFNTSVTSYQMNRSRASEPQQEPNHIVAAQMKNTEMENLVKQISTTLCFLKEEFVEFVKPEVTGLKKEMQELKDKINKIEDVMKKKSGPPSRGGDDELPTNTLEDLYIIDDDLQSQLYNQLQPQQHHHHQHHQQQQQQPQQQQQGNMYGVFQQQQQALVQRMQTPNMQQQQQQQPITSPFTNPFNNPMYNTNYGHAMNYFPQYMMPGQNNPQLSQMNQFNSAAAAAVAAQRVPLGLGGQHLAYIDPKNFNTPPSHPVQSNLPLNTMDSRISQPTTPVNLFGLLDPSNINQQDKNIMQQPTIINQLPGLPLTTLPIGGGQQPNSAVQNLWNKTFKNTPVEKAPPVNVVITSSDPLPATNTPAIQTQPPLSVTIPAQHIKPSLVPNDSNIFANNKFTSIFSNLNSNNNPPTLTQTAKQQIPSAGLTVAGPGSMPQLTFDFSKIANNNVSATNNTTNEFKSFNRTSESIDDDIDKNKSTEVEYDPRPDFKPIIALPDEIEVKTGEENEQILFSHRAKLFRFAEKEWKERGVGDIKILRNKEDGKTRILMRRDQTHKICANHKITGDMNMSMLQGKNEDNNYIWAANDYADEEIKLEKLCVRFKMAEKAKEFYNVFIVARDEAKRTESVEGKKDIGNPIKSMNIFNVNTAGAAAAAQNPVTSPFAPKLIFPHATNISGGIGSAIDANVVNAPKPSPFVGFSFDMNASTPKKSDVLTSKPFENMFNSINKTPQIVAPLNTTIYSTPSGQSPRQFEKTNQTEQTNKSGTADEDDYVPTADFKPVIPLPDLIEVQTGEENEIILFEHRAKLLRFDKTASEWKERGLGNMKILQDCNDVNKVRLVMRREIVHKLCCNQRLTKDTKFKNTPNTPTALSWVGQDFTENELTTETLTIRFKNTDICKDFMDAILKAQANMNEDDDDGGGGGVQESSKPKSDNEKLPIQGFGDKFKPKAGSWSCTGCYTSNIPTNLLCIACEMPKDDTVLKKHPKNLFGGDNSSANVNTDTKSKFNFGFGTSGMQPDTSIDKTTIFGKPESLNTLATNIVNTTTTTTTTNFQGFGDKFKPKAGSWPCNSCYTVNIPSNSYCVACESPKDDTIGKKESIGINIDTKKKFNFGFGNTGGLQSDKSNIFGSPESVVSSTTVSSSTVNQGFGDKFKPKIGSWSCNACYISNNSENSYCVACESPKDNTVIPKEPKNIFAPSTDAPKFLFGMTNMNLTKSDSTAAVDLTKLSMETTSATTNIFNSNKQSAGGFVSFNQASENPLKVADTTSINTNSALFSFPSPFGMTGEKPNPTGIAKPAFQFNLPNNDKTADYSLGKTEFNFALKPKSPGKGKSPLKNNAFGADENSEDEPENEEENNTYFTPAIPLPDKVEVKTGEENEEVVYCHRAKLFRHTLKEWKERGLGDVKILRHNITKKLRVVMRREQILKICLNHVLNKEIEYKAKDDKSWLFAANDYSEGEYETMQFCLRFKTDEIANNFMETVKKLVDSDTNDTQIIDPTSIPNISSEDRKLAEELQLPYTFFESPKSECPGCVGCDSESYVFVEPKPCDVIVENIDESPIPLHDCITASDDCKQKASISLIKESLLSTTTISVTPISNNNSISDSLSKNPNMFSGFGSHNNSININMFGGYAKEPEKSPATNKYVFNTENKDTNTFNSSIDDCIESVVNNENETSKTKSPSVLNEIVPSNNSTGGSNLFSNQADKSYMFSNPSVPLFGSNTPDFGGKPLFGANSFPTLQSSNNTKKEEEDKSSGLDMVTICKPNIESNAPEGSDKKTSTPFGIASIKSPFESSTGDDGKQTFFGNTPNIFSIPKQTQNIVGSSATEPIKSPFGGTQFPKPKDDNIFQETGFGDGGAFSSMGQLFSNNITNFNSNTSIFGGKNLFAGVGSTEQQLKTPNTTEPTIKTTITDEKSISSTASTAPETNNMFKGDGNSFVTFASLAQPVAETEKPFSSTPDVNKIEFVGLTHQDDFNRFKKNSNTPTTGNNIISPQKPNNSTNEISAADDDTNYDPHFEPIIELPKEIVVTTGEENENKIYGERATLFRYDGTAKEWKERGVGELKILHHPIQGTYRLLLRREQIHKCVLNHAISDDLTMKPFNSSNKAFCWATMNYAEDQPQLENLAVRFKNGDLANKFFNEIKNCLAQIKNRGDLLPEED